MPRDKSKDYKGGNYKGYHDPEDYEFKFRKDYQSIYTGLRDMWSEYTHPCWDLNLLEKNIVPVPYAPKNKVNCDHKYSLSYKKWVSIIDTLCKYYVEYLLSGKPLKLPARLGSLQIKKAKNSKTSSLDTVATREKGKPVFAQFPQTLHHRPLIKWNRGKECYLPYKFFWKVNFVPKRWKRVYEATQKDFSTIDRFVET